MLPKLPFPPSLDELTAQFLAAAICECHPGAAVSSFEIIEAKRYGEALVCRRGRGGCQHVQAGPDRTLVCATSALWQQAKTVQRRQACWPQTLLHGHAL
jgi:hypothetical protein